MPVRGGDSGTNIESLPGMTYETTEDIEYLKAVEVLFDSEGNVLKLGEEKFTGVVNDEYVGTLTSGSIHRINARIAVDHLPNRDFVKDTRRMILLKIHKLLPSYFFRQQHEHLTSRHLSQQPHGKHWQQYLEYHDI